ncbi:Mitochondrial copper homeostasis protein [Emmonsiellopsis sp. PD_33]|nr:Mitochondrial copper homeostasis protein [Emmonsiellopsis sp. PD_33]
MTNAKPLSRFKVSVIFPSLRIASKFPQAESHLQSSSLNAFFQQTNSPKMSADKTKEESQHSWEKAEPKFNNKGASEYFDPCQDFADRSIKCMRRNGSDRTMCSDYFQ